jgi:2-methylcitrate dehydratase PrpD
MNAQIAEIDTAAEIPPVTRIVAEWVANLKYEDIPAASIAHAKRALLDSLGCGIYGKEQ